MGWLADSESREAGLKQIESFPSRSGVPLTDIFSIISGPGSRNVHSRRKQHLF